MRKVPKRGRTRRQNQMTERFGASRRYVAIQSGGVRSIRECPVAKKASPRAAIYIRRLYYVAAPNALSIRTMSRSDCSVYRSWY
jgi:hypothetical protein